MLGENHGVMKKSVNAVSDYEFLLHRLNVNVRSALNDRVLEKRVHNPHNRQVFGAFFKVGRAHGLIPAAVGEMLQCIGLLLDEVSELGLERFLILQKRRFDGGGIREARKYLEVCLFLDEINCREVVGIQHRYFKRLTRFLERNDIVGARNGLWDKRERLKLNSLRLQVHERNAEKVCLHLA